MATDNSIVTIRKAHLDDLQDLLEIGDVYDGRDYFEAHYHTYINNPVIFPLVAEVDGKAIGFYMNHFIDDGRTLIKRAARVHPDHRGKGIFHLLSDALDKHREKFWPQVECEVFGTTNRADRASKEFEVKGFVEIVRKRVLNLYVQRDSLKALNINQEDSLRVTRMTYDDVKLLFTNKDVVDKLIPCGVLFNFFLGYKIIESNISYLVNDNAFVLASTSSPILLSASPEEAVGENCRNFTIETIKNVDVLSFAHKHIAHNVLMYTIDLYTADCYDGSVVKSHLIKHLQDFRQSTNNDGVLMVTFNSNVSEELIVDYLKDLGVVNFVPGLESHAVFYERKL